MQAETGTVAADEARPTVGTAAVLVIGGLAVNTLLNLVNTSLALPFFLDSIGTAIVTAAGGLVPGLIVASLTNVMLEVAYGFPMTNWQFTICGIATALIIWWAVRHGAFRTIGGVLILSLVVTFANAALGALVATFVFGGVTGVGVDYLVAGFVAAGQSVLSAAFWARIPANLFDKTLTVFCAYFLTPPLIRYIRSRRRQQ